MYTHELLINPRTNGILFHIVTSPENGRKVTCIGTVDDLVKLREFGYYDIPSVLKAKKGYELGEIKSRLVARETIAWQNGPTM